MSEERHVEEMIEASIEASTEEWSNDMAKLRAENERLRAALSALKTLVECDPEALDSTTDLFVAVHVADLLLNPSPSEGDPT